MTVQVNKVLAAWTRIGAGFGGRPAPESPDLERLLLDTARVIPREARLLPVAASWLCRYYELVAKQRLANLVRDELEPAATAVLGLLLETVREYAGGTGHFNEAIDLCRPDPEPKPLYEFQRSLSHLRQAAHRRASTLSRKWGLWAEPFEPKFDAIRPLAWILAHNPAYDLRTRFDGDLRASIVATLRGDRSAGRSELELARQCRASRDALRKALDRLQRHGYVARTRHGNRLGVQLAS